MSPEVIFRKKLSDTAYVLTEGDTPSRVRNALLTYGLSTGLETVRTIEVTYGGKVIGYVQSPNPPENANVRPGMLEKGTYITFTEAARKVFPATQTSEDKMRTIAADVQTLF
jgi:hypothetical protein